jgi:glycosyltransferase involved in cell wall biosynthesis
MKILIISSGSRDSGCFLRANGLAEGLRAAGQNVYLIQPPASQPLFLDYLVSLLGNILLTFWRKFDLAIAIKPFPNACIPLMIQRIYGARVIVDVDDIDHAYRPGIIGGLIRFLQRPWPKRCSLVSYHNPVLIEYIKGEFRVPSERLVQLPQGVRLALFTDREEAEKEMPDRSGPLIGYSAHLNVAAEGEVILGIIKALRKELPDSRLLVIGGGPDLGSWRRLAKRMGLAQAVRFTGYLPHERVADELMAADSCLAYYPQAEVNLTRSSIKLREYLALSKRVVCNRTGELADFSAYTYQCGDDTEDFARALAELYRSGGDGREAKGAMLVRREYDWDVVAKEFIAEVEDKLTGDQPAAP